MNIRTLWFCRPARLVLFIVATQVIRSAGNTFERTIDDTLGDSESGALPVYTPADSFSLNSNCAACTVHPDPGGAFKGTWHDSSQLAGEPPVSVTLSFNGTAISVFCIMANTASEEPSDFAFTLDGIPQEPFTHRPDNTSDFIYQQSVFNVSGLDRGEHTVVMSTNNVAGSLMLFDYATYIFDDGVVSSPASTATVTSTITSTSQARSKKHINLVPILAGTLIPIVFLILAVIIMCRRQRARYAKELEETRVHSPEVEWVQFHDPELQGWRAVMGTRKGRISAPGGVPHARQRAPPAQNSFPSTSGQPALLRTPTFRTFEQVGSPPPGYDYDFQQQQLLHLLQTKNLPVPHS